jgi:hypothetical protein
MAVAREWNRQRAARLAFLLLIAACVIPFVIRSLVLEDGPSIQVVDLDGDVRTVTLSEMKKMAILTRAGIYQNQYGNWRDQGTYSGVLLADLIGDCAYASLDVVAEDGYRVTVDRSRVEDFDYPMILAFGMDEIEVPDWEDGFRVAVLPEDGDVSNADYGVESVGSYWVRRVSRLILHL